MAGDRAVAPDAMFAAAEAVVVGVEGYYSNSPADPGGETMYGLSRAAHPAMPWPPTPDDAKAEYKSVYWDAHRCSDMPWPWALAVFDAAVNQTSFAITLAQKELGVTADGVVGPATLAAMQTEYSADHLRGYLALRADAYFRNANYATFGHGWLKRLAIIAQQGEHPPP
jgi:lysozyme family protein